MYSMP